MNVFEILQEQIPVHNAIPLDGHGRKVSCISPGHSDAEPSMHVYEDHVHCFGCGFHSDVTDVTSTVSDDAKGARDEVRAGVIIPKRA
jgi:DNA primase